MTNPKSYCINLDSRTDRWEQAQGEFTRIGIQVERFPAISGPNPHLAFNQSQYNCLKAGLDSGAEVFAVFEDDVIFDGEWSAVESALRELEGIYGWDALYLGCNITTDWFKKPERVSPTLCKLNDCWQSHAILWSRKGADYVLSQFKPDQFPIFDEWIRSMVMKDGNMYLLSPMIAFQRASFSDIWNVEADYSGCHIQGNRTLLTIR